jgi:uncharacterized membrane protein
VKVATEADDRAVGEGPDRPMTRAISVLLLVGVGVSAAILVVGLALLATTGQTGYHEPLRPTDLRVRTSPAPFPTTIGGVVRGATALTPFAVIELGILLLIATPVLRVATSAVLFLLEGDRRFALITLVVLLLLLLSLFGLG